MKPFPIAGSFALFACLGCMTPTERVVVVERISAPRPVPPRPAPQVMIAEHVDASGQPVMLGSMTEAQRRELLLPSINPIEPYTPMPPPQLAHEYQDAPSRSSGAPCSDSYYHHPDGYDVLTGIARVGLFTAAGAIIGHQFHEKGQGAAIGGGLALLTWPWFGGGCSRW
ncbi:MAG TPA: hypothetical protein VFG37_12220 [Planctomycetota bacterium]|nr:hypothetical protein [Planctomycetota bacterium]